MFESKYIPYLIYIYICILTPISIFIFIFLPYIFITLSSKMKICILKIYWVPVENKIIHYQYNLIDTLKSLGECRDMKWICSHCQHNYPDEAKSVVFGLHATLDLSLAIIMTILSFLYLDNYCLLITCILYLTLCVLCGTCPKKIHSMAYH